MKVCGLTLVHFLLTFPLINGSPFQYSVFQGNAYSGTETRQRNKNWCAHVVHKNVSCAVVGGAESFLQPEFSPCPPELPDCAQQVIYRTHFRPMYKIAYKTVTELEWRCCPGYQGHNCMEVKDLKLVQVERLPYARPASGHIPAPQAPGLQTDQLRNHPWRGDGQFGGQTSHGGSQSAQHLEEEVQRLSQMVLDMQARMTDMSSNLRLDFQEDASKMLVTLLNNLRQPASVQGAETQTIELANLSFEHETASMDEVMNKITRVRDDLDSKSNALDDLLGRINHHDGQIRLLMETVQNPQSSPSPAAPASDADLRAYLDDKIRALREEMMEGMDIKFADLKNSCDYKIMSVQEQCEGQEVNYLSLAELMDSKETDLRNEIQDLKTKLVDPGKDVSRVPDSVLARLEKLETQLNSSERNVAAQCRSVEVTLKKERAEAMKDLRTTLEDKLTSMENRLMTLWAEPSTNSPSGFQLESHDVLHREVNSVKGSVQTLENRINILDQRCSKECQANLTAVENLQEDFQKCKIAVDAIETNLNAQMNGLKAIEGQVLNYTTSIEVIYSDLSSVKGSVRGLEASLLDVGKQEPRTLQSLNSTWGQVKTGTEQEAKDVLELYRTQHQELTKRLDEMSRELKAEAEQCREKTEDVEEEVAHMDGRIVGVETLCAKLDPISSSLQRIKEGLNKHVTGLWTCVNQLNGTVNGHARDIGGLQGTCHNLQDNIANIARDLQVLRNGSPGATGVQVTTETQDFVRVRVRALLCPLVTWRPFSLSHL
ncbi:hypothetical protein Q5P01_004217 [Channa striata]|uniref:EMI domain-containing protein n=1 Tax=Channa striata TaxID=64152 RepID=A0AA88NJ07_CHASR|nr:hypothetical protein Q5P01_004217 [Channa striata]